MRAHFLARVEMSTPMEALAAVQGQLANLTTEVAEMRRQLGIVDPNLTAVIGRVDGHDQRFTDMEQNVYRYAKIREDYREQVQ